MYLNLTRDRTSFKYIYLKLIKIFLYRPNSNRVQMYSELLNFEKFEINRFELKITPMRVRN